MNCEKETLFSRAEFLFSLVVMVKQSNCPNGQVSKTDAQKSLAPLGKVARSAG